MACCVARLRGRPGLIGGVAAAAGGTAAITDVGMSGCFDSVIGMRKDLVLKKFLTKMPIRFEPAEGPGGYGAVIIDIDEKTGKATSILRFREERQ